MCVYVCVCVCVCLCVSCVVVAGLDTAAEIDPTAELHSDRDSVLTLSRPGTAEAVTVCFSVYLSVCLSVCRYWLFVSVHRFADMRFRMCS